MRDVSQDALSRLEKMLVSFVNGVDRSLPFANKIEGVLIQDFPEDDEFEELLVALASYRPGGGDYLYDETGLSKVCSEALRIVRTRLLRH